MGAYVEESLTNFRESLTEGIKHSTEKMMGSFDKPSDDTRTQHVPLVYGSKFTVANCAFDRLDLPVVVWDSVATFSLACIFFAVKLNNFLQIFSVLSL